jgi:hypothetical protein
MPTAIEKYREIRDEVRRHGTWGKALWRFGWFVVVSLVGKVIDLATDEAISRAVIWVWGQAVLLAKEPIGIVWLLLAVAFTASMIVTLCGVYIGAFLDVWRRGSGPRPLSLEEQAAVQPLRNLWNLYGKASAARLLSVFGYLNNNWKLSMYGLFLIRTNDELKNSLTTMDEAVADDTKLRAAEIHERFKAMYHTYREAVFVIAQAEAHGHIKESDYPDEYRQLRDSWVELHREFYAQLKLTNEIPGHRGQLQFGGNFMNTTASGFLRSLNVEV